MVNKKSFNQEVFVNQRNSIHSGFNICFLQIWLSNRFKIAININLMEMFMLHLLSDVALNLKDDT